MQKPTLFAFVLLFLSTLVASAEVSPSCLLKCVNNSDPSDYKLVCGKDAGTTLMCIENECLSDFYDPAVKTFLSVCKGEGITVDVKKATATLATELPEKTTSAGDDSDDETLNGDDNDKTDAKTEDDKDDESSAAKLSAGLVGFSALIMAVLAM